MSPIIEMDLHGLRTEEAKYKIEQMLKTADSSVYRIRLIHGYHGGTALQQMIRREFGYGLEKKIIRIEPGRDRGSTELVLREY